jgi:chromosome segregation ATPase
MKKTIETELQRVLAAYRAQEGEVERQAATNAEFRRQIGEVDAEIDTVKTALATAPNPPELDLAVIRTLAAERRQTEIRLEQLGQERAKIAARMRNTDRSRQAMELDLKDSQQQCWKALFEELKASVDANALESLLVAGLQAGLDESAVRAEILPNPADRSVVVNQLRERFALPE